MPLHEEVQAKVVATPRVCLCSLGIVHLTDLKCGKSHYGSAVTISLKSLLGSTRSKLPMLNSIACSIVNVQSKALQSIKSLGCEAPGSRLFVRSRVLTTSPWEIRSSSIPHGPQNERGDKSEPGDASTHCSPQTVQTASISSL